MPNDESHSYVIIYKNTYGETRVLLVEANNKQDCESIILARGLKALAYFRVSDLISLYKAKNKGKN